MTYYVSVVGDVSTSCDTSSNYVRSSPNYSESLSSEELSKVSLRDSPSENL